MFLADGLLGQFASNFFTLGFFRRLLYQLMQVAPFLFGVEASDCGGRVVGAKLFAHAAVARAGNVAGGKVDQTAMIRVPHEVQNVHSRVDVRGQSIAQIGIEVGQSGAIDDEVKVRLETLRDLAESMPRPSCDTSPSTTSTLS